MTLSPAQATPCLLCHRPSCVCYVEPPRRVVRELPMHCAAPLEGIGHCVRAPHDDRRHWTGLRWWEDVGVGL